jgi:hypothetical protein
MPWRKLDSLSLWSLAVSVVFYVLIYLMVPILAILENAEARAGQGEGGVATGVGDQWRGADGNRDGEWSASGDDPTDPALASAGGWHTVTYRTVLFAFLGLPFIR